MVGIFKEMFLKGGDPHQCDFHTNCDSEALQAQPVQVRWSSVLFDPTLPHVSPIITPNQNSNPGET